MSMRTILASMHSRFRRPKKPESTHRLGTWLFLRALGFAHLFAFLSLAEQVDGLLGSNGILPAVDYLQRVGDRFGADAFWWVPSIFWWSADDSALTGVAWLGIGLALLVTVGVLERWLLVALWFLYLSISSVGQAFFAFQWTFCCWRHPRLPSW